MVDILRFQKVYSPSKDVNCLCFFGNNGKLKQRMVLILFPQDLGPLAQGNLFLFLKARMKICILSVCTVKKSKVVRSEMEIKKFSTG